MGLGRRDFLKWTIGGALAATAAPVTVGAREPKARLPEALGILYDATICVGCKACMSACKQYNNLPPEITIPGGVWDSPLDLSAKTYNIVKLYKNGTGEVKDREIDGYSYIRRFCMHCVDPACVSACPVQALTKDRSTGIVHYNPSVCIGCRYCQIACPFNIPKFEWDKALPQIKKCQLCSHRLEQGSYPACCEFCPNGASIFGPVQELRREAYRRLQLPPGTMTAFPLRRFDSGEFVHRRVAKYQPKVYGEIDGGGTQVLILAGVPYDKLGLPTLPPESVAAHSETLMHTIYKGMIGPYVLLGALFYLVYKNTSNRDIS